MQCKPRAISLQFPPSDPCDCEVCRFFCARPGWWLVEEAREAMLHGYGSRMMLEWAPDSSFAVLSPAFKGNEAAIALQVFSGNGCTFLEAGRCTIFAESFRPLECRFCHHDRLGQGGRCHSAIERDWNTNKGKRLIRAWGSHYLRRAVP